MFLKARLLHANRKVFLNSGLREAPIIRRPLAFPVCGDLFEFLGELPPAALLNPRIRTRHFRRPEGSAASISWHQATQARSSQGLTSIEKIVARASKATGRIEFTCDTVFCARKSGVGSSFLPVPGNPARKSGVGSSFLPVPGNPVSEIRCRFIIPARKDEPTSRQEARERRIAEA